MNTYDGQLLTDPQRYLSRDLSYIQKRWDRRASRWNNDLSDPACHLNRGRHYTAFIEIASKHFALLTDNPSGGLVDIGCGTGCILRTFVDRFPWAVGIDLSPKMLLEAQKTRPANATLVEGDVFLDKNIPNSISAAVSRGVLLSHYGPENGKELLSTIRNKIRFDGLAIFDVLGAKDPNLPPGKCGYSPKMLEDLAYSSGFSQVIIEGKETDAMIVVVLRP